MLTFIIGLMVGGIVGFSAFCLLTVGKDSDRRTEYEAREVFEKSQTSSFEDTDVTAKEGGENCERHSSPSGK